MSIFEGTIEVTECYHSCPFFSWLSDVMECHHPFFNDKGTYANMIITQHNSHGRVPDECPLRNEQYQGNFAIKLKIE